jgi:hypothetical protein
MNQPAVARLLRLLLVQYAEACRDSDSLKILGAEDAGRDMWVAGPRPQPEDLRDLMACVTEPLPVEEHRCPSCGARAAVRVEQRKHGGCPNAKCVYGGDGGVGNMASDRSSVERAPAEPDDLAIIAAALGPFLHAAERPLSSPEFHELVVDSIKSLRSDAEDFERELGRHRFAVGSLLRIADVLGIVASEVGHRELPHSPSQHMVESRDASFDRGVDVRALEDRLVAVTRSTRDSVRLAVDDNARLVAELAKHTRRLADALAETNDLRDLLHESVSWISRAPLSSPGRHDLLRRVMSALSIESTPGVDPDYQAPAPVDKNGRLVRVGDELLSAGIWFRIANCTYANGIWKACDDATASTTGNKLAFFAFWNVAEHVTRPGSSGPVWSTGGYDDNWIDWGGVKRRDKQDHLGLVLQLQRLAAGVREAVGKNPTVRRLIADAGWSKTSASMLITDVLRTFGGIGIVEDPTAEVEDVPVAVLLGRGGPWSHEQATQFFCAVMEECGCSTRLLAYAPKGSGFQTLLAEVYVSAVETQTGAPHGFPLSRTAFARSSASPGWVKVNAGDPIGYLQRGLTLPEGDGIAILVNPNRRPTLF